MSSLLTGIQEMKKPVLRFAFFLYFQMVYIIFWLYNLWQEKKHVQPSRDPLLRLSATKVRSMIIDRKLTSSELIESYIKRIEEVNPIINAVVRPNFEEAREKAKEVDAQISQMNDEELKETYEQKQLYGLPFTMKDSLCLKGHVVTAGVYNWRNTPATRTAASAQRLLDAGAIFLAFTNVPETCLWIESINAIYGRTNNPYDTRRTAGGSSGGEAALHGSGSSLIGLGSDLSGSIRFPSFANGVFGFMASPGMVNTEGHLPQLETNPYILQMGRNGPITRFAEDIRLLSKVLISNTDVTKELEHPAEMSDMRLFYADGLADYLFMESINSEMKDAMMKALRHFEGKFRHVSQKIVIPIEKDGVETQLCSFMTKDDPNFTQLINDPTGNDRTPANCPLELVKWCFGSSKHILANITRGMFSIGFGTEHERKLLEVRDKVGNALKKTLGSNGILFYPSLPTLVPYHNELLFKQATLTHLGMPNLFGMPAIQCPMGLSSNGTPLGVMLIGGPGSDNLLITAAEEISVAFGGWVPPPN